VKKSHENKNIFKYDKNLYNKLKSILDSYRVSLYIITLNHEDLYTMIDYSYSELYKLLYDPVALITYEILN
jgi:hypothetical protein